MPKYVTPYTARVGAKVRPDTYDRLAQYAAETGQTMSVVLDKVLRDFLNQQEENKPQKSSKKRQ